MTVLRSPGLTAAETRTRFSLYLSVSLSLCLCQSDFFPPSADILYGAELSPLSAFMRCPCHVISVVKKNLCMQYVYINAQLMLHSIWEDNIKS